MFNPHHVQKGLILFSPLACRDTLAYARLENKRMTQVHRIAKLLHPYKRTYLSFEIGSFTIFVCPSHVAPFPILPKYPHNYLPITHYYFNFKVKDGTTKGRRWRVSDIFFVV